MVPPIPALRRPLLAVLALFAAPAAAEATDYRPAFEDDLSCLARAIYFEARGEPASGQVAVGRVILNRVADPRYPDTVCAVVYQNVHRRNRCQFSFACDGKADAIRDMESWGGILMRAARLLAEGRECPTRPGALGRIAAATHYHADYVAPFWSTKLARMGAIGRHIFYLERPRNAPAMPDIADLPLGWARVFDTARL